jgi:hypothetical protein
VVNRKYITNNNKKNKKQNNNKTERNKKHYNLGAVFDKHIKCEFQDHDVDATMKTMVKEPYVHHVPMMIVAKDMIAYITFIRITLLARCQMILRLNGYHVL